MLQAGLLRHADGLGPLPGFYSLRSVLLLLAFLLLARVRNPEQLRYQQPGEWGRLLGLDRCCAPDTLRRKLAQLCDQPVAVQAWADQLARHWLADEQDALAALFVDGHVKVYTGQARLPKHFVSRQRLQLPADTGFWIHQPGGKPLLCLRQQVDPGMVEVLREQLLPELQQLGLLRTPFGLETGRGRIAERPLQLLEGRLTVREIRFWIDQREQVARRSGHPRQPRRLAGRPAADQRQPSIVTTHPTLPAAEVAGLLRSRWSQENNFKWLRQEFGLDSLPQHATEEVEPATVIANPAMRLIDKALESDKATDSHILAGELPHEIRLAALPARHPAPHLLPRRDPHRDPARAPSRQARRGPRPGQGAVPFRRHPASRPGRRHPHRATPAHAHPSSGRRRRRPVPATQPLRHTLPRHLPAPRLRNPAPPQPPT